MLILRLLRFLLWPIRLPFVLISRLFRASRTRVGEAAVAGGASKVARRSDKEDVRYSGVFKVIQLEPSDETVIEPDQNEVAAKMAEKAQIYYKTRPDLFPTKDFYEEVEADFLEGVTRIDNEGAEDQFVRVLRLARCVANDNARILFCELAPLTLFVVLAWHWAMMLFDPFGMLRVPGDPGTLEAYLRQGASGIAMAAGALGVGALFMAFIYQFSYTHIQRQNALDLNSFIVTEFSRLNDMFRVAQRECMQAETRLDNTQHDQVGPLASSWALTYHWIGVRQFMEEMIIRNNMFQIRRNTGLYLLLGIVLCVLVGAAVSAGVVISASAWAGAQTPWWAALAHTVVLASLFTLIAFGLIMRRPFSIIASRFRKDEWNRFDTLAIGKAVAEQVSRDKLQIVIQRDTRR